MSQTIEDLVAKLRLDNTQFLQAIKDTNSRMEGLEKSVSKTGSNVDRLGNQFSSSMEKVKRKTSETSSEVEKLNSVLGKVGISLSIGAFIATSTLMAKKGIEVADSWKLAQARLTLVTSGVEQYNKAEKGLFETAQKTRTGYIESINLYTRMARALKDTNFTQQDFLRVTESVNKTMRISGASAAEAAAGVLQLGQALGSGKLAGDEFKSLSENAPRFGEAIAAGMGKPLGVLKELAAEGKLTSEVVVNALLSQGQAIDAEFARMPKVVGDAVTVMSNSIGKLVSNFNDVHNVTGIVADGIIYLAGVIDRYADKVGNLQRQYDAMSKRRNTWAWNPTQEKIFKKLGEEIDNVRKSEENLISIEGMYNYAQAKNVVASQEHAKEIEKLIQKLKEKALSVKEGEKALLELKMTEMGFTEDQKKEARAYQDTIEGVKEQKKAVKELAETYREVDKALEDYAGGMFDYLDKYAKKYREMRTAHDLADAAEITAVDTRMYEEEIAADKAARRRIEQDREESFRRIEEKQKHSLERMEDQTADFLFDTVKNWEDSYSNLFEKIGDWFLRMLLQMVAQAAAKPIILPITQALTSGITGQTYTGAGSSVMSGINTLDSLNSAYNWLTGGSAATSLSAGYTGMGLNSTAAFDTTYALSDSLFASETGSVFLDASMTPASNELAFSLGQSASAAKTFTSMLSKASPYLMAYAAGSMGYSTLGKSMGLPQGEYSSMGAGAGAAVGTWAAGTTAASTWFAGTKLGSSLGSYAGPVGTVIGAIVGTIIGGVAGSFIGGDGNRHMSLLSQPELTYGGEVNYNTGGYDYDAYRNRSITDPSTNPYYGSAFATLEDATNEAAAKIWESVDETLALFPEDVAAGVKENLSKLVFTFNEDKSWVLASDKFQEGMTNILTVFVDEIYAGIQPVIQDGFAKYAQSLVTDQTLTGLFGRLSENNILKTSLGDTSIFAADYGRAAGADFDTYMETVNAWLSSFGELEEAFKTFDATVENLLNPMGAYEKAVSDANSQFDSLKITLYNLGAAAEEYTKLEDARAQVIAKTAQSQIDALDKYTMSDYDYKRKQIDTWYNEAMAGAFAERGEIGSEKYYQLIEKIGIAYENQLISLDSTVEKLESATDGLRQSVIDVATRVYSSGTSTISFIQNDLAFRMSGMSTAEWARAQVEAYGEKYKAGDMTAADFENAMASFSEWYNAAMSEQESVANSWAAAADKAKGLYDSIQAAKESLMFGNLNVALPSMKFDEAQGVYASKLAAARGGGESEIQDYLSFAQTMLAAGQENFKSSPEYQSLYTSVISTMDELSAMVNATDYTQLLFEQAQSDSEVLKSIDKNILDFVNTVSAGAGGIINQATQTAGLDLSAIASIADKYGITPGYQHSLNLTDWLAENASVEDPGVKAAAEMAGVSAAQVLKDAKLLSTYYGMVGFADGGFSTGPTSGYPAKLHGTELIVPIDQTGRPGQVRQESSRPINVTVMVGNEEFYAVIDERADNVRVKASRRKLPGTVRAVN